MNYSEGFRHSVLRKVLPPNEQSVYEVAKEFGISPITINNWLFKLKESGLQFLDEGLRQHGLNSEHLSLREQELEETDKQRESSSAEYRAQKRNPEAEKKGTEE